MRSDDRSSRPRLWMLVAAVALTAGRVSADDDWAVLRPEESPRKMLYRALESQARELLEARRKEVAALKTPEAIRERQARIRARFLEAIGDLPEKTPLNPRVAGKAQRDGYRVERVIYESRPGHHVTAVLYLPDSPPPFPGVLVPCGHSANGKAAEAYQRICILLAKNGLAVLCFDPIGQGERLQALDENGKSLTGGSTAEHTMAGIGALLVGRSTAGYRIWDGIRSLDYLASRPEIDPSRLGCTGNSGGGTMTAYLMALDDRIAVAAPSCYITSLERLFATIGPQDAEQNITGQVAFGMDHADYAILRAPKPTLFSVGTQDFFDIKGSWDTFREVKLVYGRLGYGERIDLFESDEPHGFTRPRRQAAARWLSRWLLKKDEALVEPDFPIATDGQLQCTETGQVLSAFKGKSVFDLNAERADELAKQRARFLAGRSTAEMLEAVRRLIGVPETIRPARRIVRGEIKQDGFTVRKLVFETEPGILVPALECVPEHRDEKVPLVIHAGLESMSRFVSLNSQLPRSGRPILLLDLRGMGETAPASGTNPGPFGADWKEAFLSLHLGRPLLGQRVGDLLSVVATLIADGEDKVGIDASRAASPVVLHAAVLEPRIYAVGLEGLPISWSEVARAALTRNQLGNVVPGALAFYDLPDLAAALAPRQLRLRAVTDPAGLPVSQERIETAYAICRKAYEHFGGKAPVFEAGQPLPTRKPLLRAVDLSVGEAETIELANGKTATVKLVGLEEQVDPIRSAVREARVRIEIDGKPVSLLSGNYNLPVAANGVQVDCPITKGDRANSGEDHWSLLKDARIRLWPAGSPWIDPTTFVYPIRQRWFATSTQMANEPTYVDGGEKPATKSIYYHSGLDTGGAEGMVEVVAATDGVVVSAGTEVMTGFEKSPARPRYDVVYVLDDQGWYYRYSHLKSFDPAIKPGATVHMGQKIGVLGKEGASGGWSHLHFEIKSRQPSHRWGTEEGYAFLWQAALREQGRDVVAVARPHHLTRTGDPIVLDGSRSWSRSGAIASYEWTFGDGTTATGAKVQRTYDRPGSYSEILKVTNSRGNVDHDFAVVQVIDRAVPDQLPPTIHAAYAPTLGIKPGDAVTFKVRSFRTTEGRETWDFGDGTGPVVVRSDGNAKPLAKDGYAVTEHRFEKPGLYLVKVERTNDRGVSATARLEVVVEEPSAR